MTQAPEIPGYTWARQLGGGATSEVHEYRQDFPQRQVAVKVLHAGLSREVFERETAALGAVAAHPHVVSLLTAGTTADGRDFLVLEYCPFTGLAAQVRQQPLPMADVVALMIPLCAAVESLHQAGWVHRDVKPSNVLLTSSRMPVLSDFGLACTIGDPHPPAGFSTAWAAPGQFLREPAAIWHDVWSLGATAWTLAVGLSPFERSDEDNSDASVAARLQSGALPHFPRTDYHPLFVDILRRVLTLDSATRLSSARQLGTELQRLQHMAGLPQTPMSMLDAHASAAAAVDPDSTILDAAVAIDPDSTTLGAPAYVDPDATNLVAVPMIEQAHYFAPTVEHFEPSTMTDVDHPPATDDAQEEQRTSSPWRWILLGVLALAVAGGIWIAATSGGGKIVVPTPTPKVEPGNAVADIPPPVTNLRGKVDGTMITWTWNHPVANQRYVYTEKLDGKGATSHTAIERKVELRAKKGRNCLEISAVAANGVESEPVEECVTIG